MSLRIPKSYTPSAPNGVGTDDYRCFLLDPHLTSDAYLTGTFVKPDNRNVVHHVILYRADPDQIGAAQQLDAKDPGEGWTCFGDSGLPNSSRPRNAPWLGAWAPGATESVDAPGFGTPLAAGSQIIMQVHYNLLGGPGPDRSATLLRLAPGSEHLTPLSTMLLPAPVELPCRPQHADGPLCNRETAIADVIHRFGPVGNTNNLPLPGLRRETAPGAGHVLLAHDHPADHDPWRGRPHAPARPLHQDRGQPRHPAGARPCSTSLSGTSTTRARSRSSR